MNNKKEASIIQTRDIRNDLYTTETTLLEINRDMFHEMKKNKTFYPNKALTMQIGHYMGIDFLPKVDIEDVFGDEITHPDGTKTRKQTGIRMTHYGKRRNVDGSYMFSDPCTYEFNYADRTEIAILADEELYGQKWPDGKSKCKYYFPDNPAKQKRSRRKLELDTAQFRTQRASTGASLAVIRALTGMKTSFTPEEISVGHLNCSQIILSKDHQEALASANIQNIRNGGAIADNNNNAIGQLTGTTGDTQGDFDKKFTRPDPKPTPEVVEPVISPKPHEVKKPKPAFSLKIQYETALLDSKLDQNWKDYIKTFVTAYKHSDIICEYAIAFLNTKVNENMIQQLTAGVEQYHYHEATIKQAIPYFTGETKV